MSQGGNQSLSYIPLDWVSLSILPSTYVYKHIVGRLGEDNIYANYDLIHISYKGHKSNTLDEWYKIESLTEDITDIDGEWNIKTNHPDRPIYNCWIMRDWLKCEEIGRVSNRIIWGRPTFKGVGFIVNQDSSITNKQIELIKSYGYIVWRIKDRIAHLRRRFGLSIKVVKKGLVGHCRCLQAYIKRVFEKAFRKIFTTIKELIFGEKTKASYKKWFIKHKERYSSERTILYN